MKWVLLINGKNNYSIRNNTATQDVGFCHHTMCVPFPGVLGLEVTGNYGDVFPHKVDQNYRLKIGWIFGMGEFFVPKVIDLLKVGDAK